MRLRVIATVTSAGCAVLCGVGLGGCGGTSAVTSLAGTVAQAAQLSEQAPGFKVALSEQITGSTLPEPVTGSGTGEFDQHSHRGVLSVSVNAAGQTTAAEAQYTPTTLYERLPATAASSIARGRPAGIAARG